MDKNFRALLIQEDEFRFRIDPHDNMNVPAILFADEPLIQAMDDKVFEQIINVASLPGIVQAAYTMPDAHWGYGFPIGGVAAFDEKVGGVVSAGGVGFDISCGVRNLLTGLKREEIQPIQAKLADILYQAVPSGVGSESKIILNPQEMEAMLTKGAEWAVKQGYGEKKDLQRIEDYGKADHAVPEYVSEQAKKRQKSEMGTLGSGNHYLEVQYVAEIYDEKKAEGLGIELDDVIFSIHCGSRGLGHQIGTDYLREMTLAANQHRLQFPDKALACAPIDSELGQRYLGAMRAGINCALANRQIITHWIREACARILPRANISVLYDVSHNTCKEETHIIDNKKRNLFVHRKGATRAFGPNHPDLPEDLKALGQPVLIGGSMGTCSYILLGTSLGEHLSFSSSCHGAGRALSRHQAAKRWKGRALIDTLAKKNIIIRSGSDRGVAEEAPDSYKDVNQVVDVAEKSGISQQVAKLIPLICVKG